MLLSKKIGLLSVLVFLLTGCPQILEGKAPIQGDIVTDVSHLTKSLPLDIVAAVVEPRINPGLIVVVKEVIDNLPTEWTIQIFHSKTNESFIKESSLKGDILSGKIVLSRINRDSFSLADYNTASLTPYFWEQMLSNRVLLFEPDSAFCPSAKVPGAFDEYFTYDYVGAPWKRYNSDEKCYIYDDPKFPGKRFVQFGSIVIDDLLEQGFTDVQVISYGVGNSGLSLRNRDRVNSILRQYIPVAPYFWNRANDKYFACVGADPRSGFLVPNAQVAANFSIEQIVSENPLAFHKPWDFLNQQELATLGSKCPSLYPVMQSYLRR